MAKISKINSRSQLPYKNISKNIAALLTYTKVSYYIIIKKIKEENKESKLLTRNLYVIAPQFTCKQASR